MYNMLSVIWYNGVACTPRVLICMNLRLAYSCIILHHVCKTNLCTNTTIESVWLSLQAMVGLHCKQCTGTYQLPSQVLLDSSWRVPQEKVKGQSTERAL